MGLGNWKEESEKAGEELVQAPLCEALHASRVDSEQGSIFG
jgi:hypothetical protein